MTSGPLVSVALLSYIANLSAPLPFEHLSPAVHLCRLPKTFWARPTLGIVPHHRAKAALRDIDLSAPHGRARAWAHTRPTTIVPLGRAAQNRLRIQAN